MKLAKFLISVFLFVGLLGLSSCLHNSNKKTLWVFAASSLTDVFRDLGEAFENQLSGDSVEVRLLFAGSSSLVRQINSGAPAQILATANNLVLKDLKSTYTTEVFAQSELVIAVPINNPKVTKLKDLENADLTIGQCIIKVPCGNLANKILSSKVEIDTYETNSRAVLNKLLLGELDAGLIYKVDVIGQDSIMAISITEIPEGSAVNNYFLTTFDENSSPAARSFKDFLKSATAKAILEKNGFK